MSRMSDLWPLWAQDLARHLAIKRQFHLYGNILDRYSYPYLVEGDTQPRWGHLYVREFLHRLLLDLGYRLVVFFDIADGVTFNDEATRRLYDEVIAQLKLQQVDARGGRDPARGVDMHQCLRIFRSLLSKDITPTAVIVEHAQLICNGPENSDPAERLLLLQLWKCGREAVPIKGGTLNQALLLVSEKLNDMPTWMYLGNPIARTIMLEKPTDEERRRYFELSFRRLHAAGDSGEEAGRLIDTFTGLTQGMMNRELEGMVEISRHESIPASRPKEIIERYKFGVKNSPWATLLKNRRSCLLEAQETLSQHVKGQPAAVQAVADIIKRAALGLSGIQHSAGANKPKGILFFAGPTGVGKTEMAKALAEMLFGDPTSCIRFDMSEFSEPHSDQRLFGAPPGYIGHQEGGELTNRVKQTPFSVLLFDEIEKAHASILDKFLQVLEDGRLTSGQGETVYFTETVIIFTSNKGVYREVRDSSGQVVAREPMIFPHSWKCGTCECSVKDDPGEAACAACLHPGHVKTPTSYENMRESILRALRGYLRPELYNRIGNNFIVFDFIRSDVVAQIVERMLSAIRSDLLSRKGLRIDFGPVVPHLLDLAGANLSLGGRGIGNLLETRLVNPLARRLFDDQVLAGARIVIQELSELDRGQGFGLEWVVTHGD